jgi:hypothetical protein
VNLSFFDVRRLCEAYEGGVKSGLDGEPKHNPHPAGSAKFMAHEIGHEFGTGCRNQEESRND